jgi:hypothetical protein
LNQGAKSENFCDSACVCDITADDIANLTLDKAGSAEGVDAIHVQFGFPNHL